MFTEINNLDAEHRGIKPSHELNLPHYTYTSLSIRIIVIAYKISNTIGE